MDPNHACMVKVWYRDRAEAKRAAAKLRAAGRPKLHPYRCPVGICGGWHLTSASAADRRAMRAKYRGWRW